ncbi:MAG: hypothetical protein N3A59_00335 [Thermodesulfovibrionales bacterium]|nr:hypothetical protein [Thermodesulfovibrionales bacterium]
MPLFSKIILILFLFFNYALAFASDKNPNFKLPPQFNFSSIIKNFYKDTAEFTKLLKYRDIDESNLYGFALTKLTLGLIEEDKNAILGAKLLFTLSSEKGEHPREREIAKIGLQYTNNLLLNKSFSNDIVLDQVSAKPISIEKKPFSKNKNFKKIIIGRSSIKITNGMKIKTQVDRVTRDWISAYNITFAPWQIKKEKIVPWHEGEKIREILKNSDVQVIPVWGTLAKKIENFWYAPDAEGYFRFRISEDKIYNYPSTFIIDENTVIMNDTHGINAIAWDSLDADLVLGCGDLEGKVQAAFYLASHGVNVYMPTDRFLSILIGVKTKGTIIGSAPIRKTTNGTVIGGQSISIKIDEPIMVTNTEGGYPMQYYDTPYRYFRELEKYIGRQLRILSVDINEYGKADKLIWRAKRAGVKVIGIRVASKEEYDAVSWFLKSDKSHRAILFHSAVYPEGYRLFFEFPNQTTFGDINIVVE